MYFVEGKSILFFELSQIFDQKRVMSTPKWWKHRTSYYQKVQTIQISNSKTECVLCVPHFLTQILLVGFLRNSREKEEQIAKHADVRFPAATVSKFACSWSIYQSQRSSPDAPTIESECRKFKTTTSNQNKKLNRWNYLRKLSNH